MRLTDKNNNPIQKKIAIKYIKRLIHFFEACDGAYFENMHGICSAIILLDLNLIIDFSDIKKRYRRSEIKKRYRRSEKSGGTIFKESEAGNWYFSNDVERIEYLTKILKSLENGE